MNHNTNALNNPKKERKLPALLNRKNKTTTIDPRLET